MATRPPTFKRGQRRLLAPLTQLGEVLRAAGLTVSWPLRLLPTSGGYSLGLDARWSERQLARIISGPAADHSYLIMLRRRQGHLFTDTGKTKKAWEINDNQTITGTPNIELLTDSRTHVPLFQLDPCT